MQNDERRTTIQIEVTRNDVSIDLRGCTSSHMFMCVLDALLAGAVQWELDHENETAQSLLRHLFSQTQSYHSTGGRSVEVSSISSLKARAN